MAQLYDFGTYHDGGSIILLRPKNEAAEEWLAEHVTGETTWLGGALAVEARYIDDLVNGITEDGLTVGPIW